MNKIIYMIRRILGLNYRSFFETINALHHKIHKNRVWLFLDMVYCGLRYGAGYKDYELFAFYDLTPAQRATYVTRGVNNQIVKLLNDRAFIQCLDDKVAFNIKYAPYIKRGWMDMRTATLEEFCTYMEGRDEIIAKPLDACCGQGVEKIAKADFQNLEEMYAHLKASNAGLVEDYIIQHKDVSAIYPHSVNTYRIFTVLAEGKSHVVHACIRIGNGGSCVDNINAGGMSTSVDIETGRIEYPAFDKNSVSYEKHPMTGFAFVGAQLPYWEEALQMCLDAAHVIPQVGYVGWDVAVGENGPQLIEGNPFPDHDLLQMPPNMPNKLGKLPKFKELVKGL